MAWKNLIISGGGRKWRVLVTGKLAGKDELPRPTSESSGGQLCSSNDHWPRVDDMSTNCQLAESAASLSPLKDTCSHVHSQLVTKNSHDFGWYHYHLSPITLHWSAGVTDCWLAFVYYYFKLCLPHATYSHYPWCAGHGSHAKYTGTVPITFDKPFFLQCESYARESVSISSANDGDHKV